MTDILKYIKLGTNTKEWFNYDGQPLPIRPLSSYELDEVMLKVLQEGITQQIFDSLYKIKMNLILEDEVNIPINPQNYKNFFLYYNRIDYWTVYHGMKDFQPEDFSKPDFDKEFENDFDDWKIDFPKGYYVVRKMKYVHEIAKNIRNMSNQPLVKLSGVLKNNRGVNLASMVFVFHHPLASEAWKLTPLQESFLYYGRPGAPIIIASEEDLPGISGVMSIKEVMEKLKHLGFGKKK